METATRCPVCAESLAGTIRACARCATPHHEDCYTYAGGCAIYGCVERPAAAAEPAGFVPGAGDLTFEISPQQGTPDGSEPLSMRIIAPFVASLPFQLMVWTPLPVVLMIAYAITARRRWRVDPAARELQTSLAVAGWTIQRREIPFDEIRRFEVRQDELEVALMASLADGSVVSIAVGLRGPYNTVANLDVVERLDDFIRGLRAHVPIHVVRYQAEDPATLPKRIARLREAARESSARSRLPAATCVAAVAAILLMCVRMGDVFGTVCLGAQLTWVALLLVWRRMPPGGRLGARLSGWRVTQLENALRNQPTGPVESGLTILAAVAMVVMGTCAAVYGMAGWGWILLGAVCGILTLVQPWVRRAWAEGCASTAMPLEPGAEAPLVDTIGRGVRSVMMVAAPVVGFMSVQLTSESNETPRGALIKFAVESTKSCRSSEEDIGRALEQAMTSAEPDYGRLNTALKAHAALATRLLADFAKLRPAWGVPARELELSLGAVLRRHVTLYDPLARTLAKLPEMSDHNRFHALQSALALDDVDDVNEALRFALRRVALAYSSEPEVPPKMIAPAILAFANVGVIRLSVAVHDLQVGTGHDGDRVDEAGWSKARARCLDRLSRVTRALDLIRYDVEGSPAVRSSLREACEKVRAIAMMDVQAAAKVLERHDELTAAVSQQIEAFARQHGVQ